MLLERKFRYAAVLAKLPEHRLEKQLLLVKDSCVGGAGFSTPRPVARTKVQEPEVGRTVLTSCGARLAQSSGHGSVGDAVASRSWRCVAPGLGHSKANSKSQRAGGETRGRGIRPRRKASSGEEEGAEKEGGGGDEGGAAPAATAATTAAATAAAAAATEPRRSAVLGVEGGRRRRAESREERTKERERQREKAREHLTNNNSNGVAKV